jgi:hypothetical protein
MKISIIDQGTRTINKLHYRWVISLVLATQHTYIQSMLNLARFISFLLHFVYKFLTVLTVGLTCNHRHRHWTEWGISHSWAEFMIFASPVRHDKQNFWQILLRTDIRLVFCNRKLMRTETDIFFIRNRTTICSWTLNEDCYQMLCFQMQCS